MLDDERAIHVFDSPEDAMSWVEPIDIENQEYRFCDEAGQIYEGIVDKPNRFTLGDCTLRTVGAPNTQNAVELIDAAISIEPNDKFSNIESLRRHITSRST